VVAPERKEPEQRVILREPEPVTSAPGIPLRASLDGRPNSITSSAITSVDQGLALLKQRGAKVRMENLDDGSCRLRCSVPNRRQPNLLRTYEVQARDPISALRAVLDQVDRENQTQ
jgi:hypothetical protein